MTVAPRLAAGVAQILVELGVHPEGVRLERPARPEHGDFSTNAALVAAKNAGRNPRELAQALVARLSELQLPHVEKIDIAGPGFVNFHLAPSWLHEALADVLREGEQHYAAPNLGQGERVQLEFVSANPTGPLHVGNGWLGSYGDALARLMHRCGYVVEREYYVNDTGNQIRMLGESLLARRRGESPPESGYQGAYVAEIASHYEGPDEVVAAGRYAAEVILANIRETLDRIGIVFDQWFSQASIEESGRVAAMIDQLQARGLVFESEGAIWLRSTEFGDVRDRVLVKADGDATYLAGDLAYHANKFLERGFDRVIDVFGADHHGQVASLRAGIEALGIDPARLEVRLGQLVSLASGRMSKRSGVYVRLDELIDELGPDATRLLSLMNSIDQATTLDLDVVTSQSMENPVFYVQYAHARIASIGRVAAERGVARPPLEETNFAALLHERELDLIRCLLELPTVMYDACTDRAPYKVTNWVRRLAGAFHGFYHDCRVLDPAVPGDLVGARLWLVEGARLGLSIALSVLGVHAPEQM